MRKQPIAVLGSGSWGTAMVGLLLANGHPLHWWVRRPQVAEHIRQHGRNPAYLPDLSLDTRHLVVHDHPQDALAAAEHVLLVTPSAHIQAAIADVAPHLLLAKSYASATKGLVPHTQYTLTQWLHYDLQIPRAQLSVVSGPSHSEEVAQQMQTWLTASAFHPDLAAFWQRALVQPWLHVDTGTDVDGVEWAGVLKNVYAIAVGMGLGLGHGNNMLAALVAASLNEMQNLLQQMAPHAERRMGTAPILGDLLTTCYSPHSRNRTLGELLGSGFSVAQARAKMQMVAEGYFSAKTLVENCGVQAPIVQMVYDTLFKDVAAADTYARMVNLL